MKQLILSFFILFSVTTVTYSQFSLGELPYKYNALEPYIDSTTMYIHFNNHHAAYVTNLNNALSKYPELYKKSITEILQSLSEVPADIQTVVRNNGGGHYNHTFFWSIMSSPNSSKMTPALEKKLIENFGSIDNFKTELEKAATTRFGSGWAWLIKEPGGKLRIISTANQDNPIMSIAEIKGKPVLALDVWEHAYYLKYQSKRAAYVKAFWNVVKWSEVEKLINE